MTAGVYAYLPSMAQEDLVEAGECLASRNPNGSATLLLRCVKAMLRELHWSLMGETGAEMDWNTMENGVSNSIADYGKRMYILGPLRDLRFNFRNKTMHGLKRFGMEDGQRLFYLCIEAITRMTENLSEHSRPEGIA